MDEGFSSPSTGSIASLKAKLEQLSPIDVESSMAQRSKRWSSDLSSAASDFSFHSFTSSRSSLETEASDITTTTTTTTPPPPSRSRSSTLWKSDLQPVTAQQIPCKPPLKVILGTASVGSSLSPLAKISDTEAAANFVNSFRARGYSDIDTARAYPVGRGGTCERLLGENKLKLGTWANVSTKVSSFMPGSHKARNIELSINRSVEALNTDGVDIMYLHAPDKHTPFAETCEAMHRAHLEGKFERFGLSNFSLEQVEEVVELCGKNGWIMPSVYQGQYNPICRGAEEALFAVLRRHNIAFYAYSPSACGFFSAKVSRLSTTDRSSRWNTASPLGAKYARDYFHEPLFAAAELVREQAQKFGISGHAAALRWTTWHSHLAAEEGDAVIIGSSTQAQLEENMDILEQGPLPEALLQVLAGVWDDVRHLDKGPRFAFV